MKPKNKQKRLEARQKDWENIKANDTRGPKVKMVNKSGFTRPGSNNK